MQDKLLKIIKDTVGEFGGAGSEKLVDLLYNKKNVDESLIAKKMNFTVNQTRNILYRLADEGLVSFIRKKDKKKGGWYVYFWTLDVLKCLIRCREKTERKINELKISLSNLEKETFYYCKNCEIEYNQESALLSEYTCSECGEVLEMKNPEKAISDLKGQISRQELFLKQLDLQIGDIEAKSQKVRDKKARAEQRKKELERARKRAAAKAAKAVVQKKARLDFVKKGKPIGSRSSNKLTKRNR